MMTSLRDRPPKPESDKICPLCGKKLEPEWGWNDWEIPEIHRECEQKIEYYKRLGIDKRYWLLPEFKIEEGNKKAWEAVEDFIKNNGPKGLFLFGGAGTGKTHLVTKIAQEVDMETKLIKFPELIMRLKGNFDGSSYENESIIENLANINLLIIDDIGAEKASEWVSEIIYILIDKRYSNMKTTVITSNFTPQELAERVGDRIVSRISEMCRIIEIKTSDKRKGVK